MTGVICSLTFNPTLTNDRTGGATKQGSEYDLRCRTLAVPNHKLKFAQPDSYVHMEGLASVADPGSWAYNEQQGDPPGKNVKQNVQLPPFLTRVPANVEIGSKDGLRIKGRAGP
ncbi:hypothetical protein Bbelb_112570 [Branchiostoma belcheri]|nr:hypothetical protein Bbelb_112570 [Branchiostoma belcheri]